MNRCTETGKPQISILMAVYEPRMDWLREQLLSLDAQTYPNIKLYIRDDCSVDVSYEAIQSCIQDCICAFPYEIRRNEKNLGSNKTFELLTWEASGEYFAYCDQDDIWLPDKLEKLEKDLSQTGATLICSDVFLIDEKGAEFAQSITELRPRHVFCQNSKSAPALIYRNIVIGCTTLIRAQTARDALPFATHMVHDHYLAFFSALRGNIIIHEENLVQYRIHSSNQTGVLTQIVDRRSYIERHMMPFCDRIAELQARFALPELEQAARWAEARQQNAAGQWRGVRQLWKMRHLNITTTLFELFALRLPGPMFRVLIKRIQAGKM